MAQPEKLEGEPLLSKKRGRPAKWFPQVVRPEDTRLALQWMDKFCPEDKTLLRLRRDWNTFRRLNPNLSPVELETSRCFNARKQRWGKVLVQRLVGFIEHRCGNTMRDSFACRRHGWKCSLRGSFHCGVRSAAIHRRFGWTVDSSGFRRYNGRIFQEDHEL